MSDPRCDDDGSPRNAVRGLVLEILSERGPVKPFSDDDTLAEIGIASVDMVTLLLGVERMFDLEVPQDEITPDVFRSIASIAALIERLRPDTASN